MRGTEIALAASWLVLLAGAPALAQSGWSPGPLAPGQTAVHPGDAPPLGSPMTQNANPDQIVSGTSVACFSSGQTTDTSWWRRYDLDLDHGFSGEVFANSVTYGIEQAIGEQSVTVNVYCLDDGLPFETAFLVLADSASQPHSDTTFEFFNVAMDASCDAASQSMVVELRSEDCAESDACTSLLIGANDLGQTAPSYVSAADCDVFEPTDLAPLGFPDTHVIQVVFASEGVIECFCCGCDTPACQAGCGSVPCIEICCECCGCGTEACEARCGGLECVETCETPASSGPAAWIAVLLLLGLSTAVLLRRVRG